MRYKTTDKQFERPYSLNSRIFIYDRDIKPPLGSSVNFWEKFVPKHTCWCQIDTVKGVTVFDQSNTERVVTHRFIIRYVPPDSKLNWFDFLGIGLNDLSVSGSFVGSTNLTYKVVIESVGIVDKFKWTSDNGATWVEHVSITGVAQVLSNGITVTFSAITGHTLNDAWNFNFVKGIKISSQDYILYKNQYMNLQQIFDVLTVEDSGQESRNLSLLAALTGDENVPANFA